MQIVCIYFLLFIMYSFIGWAMEVLVTYHDTNKLVDRGFLIGPICPIYGFGFLLISILLHRYLNDPIVLFVMAMLICSLLEYFTSYLMEKLFKARWWDYSHKKFNINGRICVDNLVIFGIMGLIAMYLINPFLEGIIRSFSNLTLYIISIVIMVILLADMCISLKVISGFKNIAKTVKKDSTEEITNKVRELLTLKGGLYKRLATAFNFKASEKLLKELKMKVTKSIEKKVEKAKVVIESEKKKRKAQRIKIKNEYKLRINKLKEMLINERQKEKEELKKLK